MCSLCSIIGALRTGSYMLSIITTGGFRESVCDNIFYTAPVTKFWAYAFVLSKAPELGEASSFYSPLEHTKCPHVVFKAAFHADVAARLKRSRA